MHAFFIFSFASQKSYDILCSSIVEDFMQQRTLSKELPQKLGEVVFLRGWVHTIRLLGKVAFLILRDRAGYVQIFIQDNATIKSIAKAQPGSVLSVEGKVVASEEARHGVEIIEPNITVEVLIQEALPIEYYRPEIPSDLDTILDHQSLALRNEKNQAIFRVQGHIVRSFREYMQNTVEAQEYFGPSLVSSSSEGGAEFFQVSYFEQTASLAQSSQLYKQMLVGVYERVFAVMPFFRAEPSHTTRHLSEGKQLEFEMGFFSHWHEILEVQEGFIRALLATLQRDAKEDFMLLDAPILTVPQNAPIPRLSFHEAQQKCFEITGVDTRKEPDLSPAEERVLCQYAKKEFDSDFIFITDWLKTKRPFYSFPKEGANHLTNTFDLLCNGSEITSGGQREHRYAEIVAALQAQGMAPSAFSEYLEIFRFGMPPHGGFGLGLERLTMHLLGLKNIRQAVLFPSDTKRVAGVRLVFTAVHGAENICATILRKMQKGNASFEHSKAAVEKSSFVSPSVKSLLLEGKKSKKHYMFVLPSVGQLDVAAITQLVGERCSFVSSEKILAQYGLCVGGIPPFGNLLKVETFFDISIQKSSRVVCSIGTLEDCIEVDTHDLISIISPKLADFVKKINYN